MFQQYYSLVRAAIVQILCSIVAIFCVTTVLMGVDPWSAIIIVFTLGAILIDLLGLMYWWSIDFNAISVVNLVMVSDLNVRLCHLVV